MVLNEKQDEHKPFIHADRARGKVYRTVEEEEEDLRTCRWIKVGVDYDRERLRVNFRAHNNST